MAADETFPTVHMLCGPSMIPIVQPEKNPRLLDQFWTPMRCGIRSSQKYENQESILHYSLSDFRRWPRIDRHKLHTTPLPKTILDMNMRKYQVQFTTLFVGGRELTSPTPVHNHK